MFAGQAAEKFKARAAKVTQEAAKPQIPAPAITPSPAEPASALPADFFDSSSAPNTNLPSDFFDTSSAPSAKRARSNGGFPDPFYFHLLELLVGGVDPFPLLGLLVLKS
jgi:hypothetical protein